VGREEPLEREKASRVDIAACKAQKQRQQRPIFDVQRHHTANISVRARDSHCRARPPRGWHPRSCSGRPQSRQSDAHRSGSPREAVRRRPTRRCPFRPYNRNVRLHVDRIGRRCDYVILNLLTFLPMDARPPLDAHGRFASPLRCRCRLRRITTLSDQRRSLARNSTASRSPIRISRASCRQQSLNLQMYMTVLQAAGGPYNPGAFSPVALPVTAHFPRTPSANRERTPALMGALSIPRTEYRRPYRCCGCRRRRQRHGAARCSPGRWSRNRRPAPHQSCRLRHRAHRAW